MKCWLQRCIHFGGCLLQGWRHVTNPQSPQSPPFWIFSLGRDSGKTQPWLVSSSIGGVHIRMSRYVKTMNWTRVCYKLCNSPTKHIERSVCMALWFWKSTSCFFSPLIHLPNVSSNDFFRFLTAVPMCARNTKTDRQSETPDTSRDR